MIWMNQVFGMVMFAAPSVVEKSFEEQTSKTLK